MQKRRYCKKKCSLKMDSSNCEVKIREIKPLYIKSAKPFILDFKIKQNNCFYSYLKIKRHPLHGKLYKIGSSTLIYKSHKCFYGLDIFQVILEDTNKFKHVETVFLSIK